jgi:hypothetical protein
MSSHRYDLLSKVCCLLLYFTTINQVLRLQRIELDLIELLRIMNREVCGRKVCVLFYGTILKEMRKQAINLSTAGPNLRFELGTSRMYLRPLPVCQPTRYLVRPAEEDLKYSLKKTGNYILNGRLYVFKFQRQIYESTHCIHSLASNYAIVVYFSKSTLTTKMSGCPVLNGNKTKRYMSSTAKYIGEIDTFANTGPHKASYLISTSQYGHH